MLHWLSDYKKFRDEIRKVKVEDFNELKKILVNNEQLQTALVTQKTQHENEIMSLNHAISLERERVKDEKEREIASLKHTLKLKEVEFEKEKETLLLQAQQTISKQREEFLEKNFKDLKTGVDDSFDRAMRSIDVFAKRLPEFRAKRIEHDGDKGGINIDIDSDK
ncbi:MAG: hypothetical protein ABIG52_01330 [Nanoarchaeota archaeon]